MHPTPNDRGKTSAHKPAAPKNMAKADDKAAFEAMLSQMSDSDSDNDSDGGGAKGAKSLGRNALKIPPPKPARPPAASSKTTNDDTSSSSGSRGGGGNKYQDDGSIMEEEMAGTSRANMASSSFTHSTSSSSSSSSRSHDSAHASYYSSERKDAPEPRRSIVERILNDSKESSRGAMRRAGSFESLYDNQDGFEGCRRQALGADSVMSEIENFGCSAAAAQPFATAAEVSSSSWGGGAGRGPPPKSLIGALPDAGDTFAPTRRWLTRPCTKGEGPLRCYVERERNVLSLQVRYIYSPYRPVYPLCTPLLNQAAAYT